MLWEASSPLLIAIYLMAEAFALIDGLLLAQQIGSNRVQIQADCIEVVDTMLDGGFSATASAAIYEDCN